MAKRVMIVFGTRPEAIKMAPVIAELRRHEAVEVEVVVTAQHREMLDQVLGVFGIVPDEDLDIMRPGQGLHGLFATILEAMGDTIARRSPDLVLVHGDTTTTLAVALAAFYAGVPVGHVEAGLRTGDMRAPWPEEANRRLTAPLASLHFAPTAQAAANLVREGIARDSIHVTGNTVVDALQKIVSVLATDDALARTIGDRFGFLDPDLKLVLVTGHRRENFGGAFDSVCEALAAIASRGDCQVVYPVHLNPQAREPVQRILGGQRNVFLLEPLDYLSFVYLMERAHMVITDSGGIQEEAPSVGVPVLVTRETTERPEGVEAGTVRLVGTDTREIERQAARLLDDPQWHRAMARAVNPYGDGLAACRIVDIVLRS